MSPVSGISFITPPTTTNTWIPTAVDRPAASSLPNGVAHATAVRMPRSMMMRVQNEQRHDAGESELLTERGHDEVGLGERNEVGMPLPKADAENTAAGKAVQTLSDLVAVAGFVGERVEPDVHTQAEHARRAGRQRRRRRRRAAAPMMIHDRRSVAM